MGAARVPIPDSLAATLVLIRHAESTWVAEGRFQGRADPPLSALGERQAMLVAERLRPGVPRGPLPIPDGRPSELRHSPLARAARTAAIVGQALGLDAGARLVPVPDLAEIGQGAWEGLTVAEVEAQYAHELALWRRDPARHNAPRGEPLVDAAARVERALRATITALDAPTGAPDGPPESGRWTIVLAHDGILRLCLLALLDLPLEGFWTVPFGLGMLSVVELSGGRAALRAHALADHLAPLMGVPRGGEEARGDRRGVL